MASQLTKRGYKYRVLPTNDSDTFNDFLNDDSEFNIKKLDTDLEKLDDKVLLEGKRQQKFDFIENQVVQEGLFKGSSFTIKDRITFQVEFIYDGKQSGTIIQLGASNVGGFNLYVDAARKKIVIYVSNGTVYTVSDLENISAGNYRIVIMYENERFNIIINNNNYEVDASYMMKATRTPHRDFGDGLLYDNVILTSQEIERNFQVLKNTPSIKELHATDSTGKTSILKWATDSTHVDMQTGRTLEEEYTSLLSRFGKEFTSADGSTIEVNNAIPSKVLSTEIKGNTQLFKRAKGSQDEWIVIPNDEGRDTVAFEYKLDSTQAIISNNGQSYPIYESTIQGKTRILNAQGVEVEAGTAGAKLVSLEPNDSKLSKLGSTPSISDTIDRAKKILKLNTIEIELDGTESWNYFDITTGNNLRQMYIQPISRTAVDNKGTINCLSTHFKPTRFNNREKTYVVNHVFVTGNLIAVMRNKTETVEQWKSYLAQQKANGTPVIIRYQLATPQEIQLTEEQLKAYDTYKKLISLGGVGDVKDTLEILEDGSAVWTQNTKELIFDGSESWAEETPGIYRLSSTESVFGKILNSEGKVRVKSNLYNGDTWSNGWVKDGIVFLHTGGALFVRDTKIATVQDFKSKLSTTNLIVRGSLGTPIVIHIPKELVPSILTHNQTNILEVGGAVKPSSFKVTVPTTDGIKKEYTLTPINGWKGTAKANLLQTGDIGLVLDLTIPSSFNASVCSLATELRPKAERTVLGYNGNTPVVVKIGTDGTVKLPVTATGVVKLDDTYKL